MLQGSCCCGLIKFVVTKQPHLMGTCHCSRCRKSGSSTFIIVESAEVKIIKGEDQIRSYVPVLPYKYTRYFCSQCGSSLGGLGASGERTLSIPANCFDSPLTIKNSYHEFVDNKPSWYEIHDTAIQYNTYPSRSWISSLFSLFNFN